MPLKITVYADVLFAVNFVINMLLISLTAMVTKSRVSIWRKFLSSSIGAVYAVLMFVPQFAFAGALISKFVLLSVMTAVSFGFAGIRQYIRQLCLFGGITLMCGGCTLAYVYFSDSSVVSVSNGIVYFDTSLGTVAGCALICGAVMKISAAVYRQHRLRDYRSMIVYKDGKSVVLRVMVDTGNMLTDPLTGSPVIVAEKSALKGIIPMEIDTEDIEALSCCISGVRLIPFRSLGCERGLMTGFKPDKICADCTVSDNVTLAIASGRLSSEGEYNAIAGPESFEK